MRKLIGLVVIVAALTTPFLLSFRQKPQARPRINYYASTNRPKVLVLSAPNGSILCQINVTALPVFVRFINQGWCSVVLPNNQTGFIKQSQISLTSTAIINKPGFGWSKSGKQLLFLKGNSIVQLLNTTSDKCLIKIQGIKCYVDRRLLLNFAH